MTDAQNQPPPPASPEDLDPAEALRISEERLFYCQQRGIDPQEATALIVGGFCQAVLEELPMEFAVEAKKLLDDYVSIGFEGLILRNSNTFEDDYLRGGIRTYDIQKWKLFTDSEYEIINVIPDKNNNAIYVCKTNMGAEFNVTPKCSHEMKKNILNNKNKYIG